MRNDFPRPRSQRRRGFPQLRILPHPAVKINPRPARARRFRQARPPPQNAAASLLGGRKEVDNTPAARYHI